MRWNQSLNRLFVGSAASLLAVLSTTAYAIPRGPCDTKPDVCCEEPKPGPFAFSFPYDVNLSCPKDFYVYASGLAFQASEDGLAWGLSNSNGVTSDTGYPLDGEALNFSTDSKSWGYQPGMRFGLGFYLHHDAWNLDFQWTWLNITNYKSYRATSGEGFYPVWLDTANTPNANWTAVSASWDAQYDMIDVRLGKPYHVSRYFILNPHFGIRGGWINQQFNVHYAGTFSHTGVVSSNENDFWGIGARAGLMSEWCIGKGWGLFGNLAAAILYGKFEVSQTDNDTTLGYDWEENFYRNVPNMDLQVGINWMKYFSKNRYRLSIAAAYEFHQWWDQLNLRNFNYGNAYPSSTKVPGDLTLNGFSLNVKFDI